MQWAAGNFNSDDPQVTHHANVAAIEKYNAYGEILELDYEHYVEVMSDDDGEQKRA